MSKIKIYLGNSIYNVITVFRSDLRVKYQIIIKLS